MSTLEVEHLLLFARAPGPPAAAPGGRSRGINPLVKRCRFRSTLGRLLARLTGQVTELARLAVGLLAEQRDEHLRGGARAGTRARHYAHLVPVAVFRVVVR